MIGSYLVKTENESVFKNQKYINIKNRLVYILYLYIFVVVVVKIET